MAPAGRTCNHRAHSGHSRPAGQHPGPVAVPEQSSFLQPGTVQGSRYLHCVCAAGGSCLGTCFQHASESRQVAFTYFLIYLFISLTQAPLRGSVPTVFRGSRALSWLAGKPGATSPGEQQGWSTARLWHFHRSQRHLRLPPTAPGNCFQGSGLFRLPPQLVAVAPPLSGL